MFYVMRVMDTNVNCVGMIVAIDNAVRMLKTNKNFKENIFIIMSLYLIGVLVGIFIEFIGILL